MTITIREAGLDDAEAISSIINDIVAEGRTSLRTFTPEEEREFLGAQKPREAIFVAEEDGDVIGFQGIGEFAQWSLSMAHVGNILTFVKRDHRGRGVARLLTETTLRFARENGYEKISTYIIADNEPAVEFYKGLGFEVVGLWRKQVKLDDGYHDDVIVELFL
jgi:L-amino acid N-acyltransferase YncA